MVRAKFENGVIVPLDPVPPEWRDGRELQVEETGLGLDESPEVIDRWYQELEAICAQMPDDPEDERRLQEALDEADRIAKEQVRREMGLAG